MENRLNALFVHKDIFLDFDQCLPSCQAPPKNVIVPAFEHLRLLAFEL